MIWKGYKRWVMIARRTAEGLYRTTGVCPNCGGIIRQFDSPAVAFDELMEFMPTDCPQCGWEEDGEQIQTPVAP